MTNEHIAHQKKNASVIFIFAAIVFLISISTLVNALKKNNSFLQDQSAVLDVTDKAGSSRDKFVYAGFAISLVVLFSINLIFFIQLSKILSKIEKFDIDFTEKMETARKDQTDEIKELVMTRGVLLERLAENKKAIEEMKKTKNTKK